jgi:uncharacterized membrane protein
MSEAVETELRAIRRTIDAIHWEAAHIRVRVWVTAGAVAVLTTVLLWIAVTVMRPGWSLPVEARARWTTLEEAHAQLTPENQRLLMQMLRDVRRKQPLPAP